MRTRTIKTLMAVILSAMTLLSAIGCGEKEPAEISVSGVSVSKTSVTLKEGASESLTATVSPADASNKAVSWASSNTAVATVDNSGRVTGVKAGSATITVTTSDGGKTATCSVTVEANIINVTGVTLDKATAALTPGGEVTLAATVAPADATDKTISWTSSDESVATVSNGKVKAVGAGKATITVKTTDGGKTATCEVTVTVPVEGVSLSETEVEMSEEGEITLTATVTPDNATDKAVTWASSDEAVATVSDGKVTGVKAGEAVITVTTADGGKTAECKVTVTPKEIPVEEVEFAEASVTVAQGESAVVTVSFSPAGATNKAVTFESSDESVATVDEEGNVTGVKAGKATITVTTEDGGKTATCEVTVTVPVTGVRLNVTEREILKGNAGIIIATVEPEDATNKNVTWSSSDESVVKVNQEGEITARAEGKATVTVTTEDGGYTAECEVTVSNKVYRVASITLDKTSTTIYTGNNLKLTPTISPTNASDKSVTWKSSNTSVATVTASGIVMGKKAGNATITCTANDGSGKSASCSVTVKDRYSVYYNGKEVGSSVSYTWATAQYATNDIGFRLYDNQEKKYLSGKYLTFTSMDEGIAVDKGWNATQRTVHIKTFGSVAIGFNYTTDAISLLIKTLTLNVVYPTLEAHYKGVSLPGSKTIFMNSVNESIPFQLYDKSNGNYVYTTSSNSKIELSNTAVATYQSSSYGISAKKEGNTQLYFYYMGRSVDICYVTIVHACDIYYNGSKLTSTSSFTYGSNDQRILFRLYDKVDKKYVVLCTAYTSGGGGGVFTTQHKNLSCTSTKETVIRVSGSVYFTTYGSPGYDWVNYSESKGSSTLTFIYYGEEIGRTTMTVR